MNAEYIRNTPHTGEEHVDTLLPQHTAASTSAAHEDPCLRPGKKRSSCHKYSSPQSDDGTNYQHTRMASHYNRKEKYRIFTIGKCNDGY